MAELARAGLEVLALSARSARSAPIREIGFSLGPGSITALIGPAGGGRGTLVDALAGLALASRGAIRLDGRDLQGLDSRRRLLAGLALLPSVPDLLPGDSVGHVLALARALARRPLGAWLRRPLGGLAAADWRELGAVLRRTGLVELAYGAPTALPIAARQALQLAQALLARPRLLLLDHPWRRLDAAERAAHARLLAGLRELGIVVLLAESDLALLATIADRVLVVADGRLIADAPPDALADSDGVRAAFLGSAA
jgi:ABC-type branched-subunit amino acid transport system ATPase component